MAISCIVNLGKEIHEDNSPYREWIVFGSAFMDEISWDGYHVAADVYEFDLSLISISHEVIVAVYHLSGVPGSATLVHVKQGWYRNSDDVEVFSWDYDVNLPPGYEYSFEGCSWIGWLSDLYQPTAGGYAEEIRDNGEYYYKLILSGGATYDSGEYHFTVTNIPQYDLTVTCDPVAGGTVDPNTGTFYKDEEVSLDPTPEAGYVFSGWEGDLTGSADPGILYMTADKNNVIAKFSAVYDGQPGHLWVKSGSYVRLDYTDAFGQARYLFDGWVVPEAYGQPGHIWIEGHDIRWCGGTQRVCYATGATTGNTGTAGHIWIEGTELHYIDADGDERYKEGTAL